MNESASFDLTTEDRALVAAATEVIRRNFVRGRHTVGAAVRTGSGRVYTGVNIDTCGYGPCAEPIAIGSAISDGARRIEAVVAVCGRTEDYPVLAPCGNCRQLLTDYCPGASVILPRNGGLAKVAAAELLPDAYRKRRR